MKLSELRAPRGANKKIKRRGRGSASGHGKTSCRGHKGAKARSGTVTHRAFEGGQMPLVRRLPKRGFTARNKIVFQVVNLDKLNSFKENSSVNRETLFENGMVRKKDNPIKILGEGKLSKPITVQADAFSKEARKKIEAAGGKAEIVSSVR